MSIVLVGVNHRTAPVAVRELLAFSDQGCADGLRMLVDGEVVREGLIVSTCNRVEVLTATANGQLREGAERIADFLSRSRSLPRESFSPHLYQHVDDQVLFARLSFLSLAHCLALLLPNGTRTPILFQDLPHLFS